MELEYRFATADDIEILMQARLDMLRVVNDLGPDYVYDEDFVRSSRDYFLNGDQISTDAAYRRQGIGFAMTNMLIEAAWNRGATEISLDATESGRALYIKCGFKDSDECMVLVRDLRC